MIRCDLPIFYTGQRILLLAHAEARSKAYAGRSARATFGRIINCTARQLKGCLILPVIVRTEGLQ